MPESGMDKLQSRRQCCQRLQAFTTLATVVAVTLAWIPATWLRERFLGEAIRDVTVLDIRAGNGDELEASFRTHNYSWQERLRWLCKNYLEGFGDEGIVSREALHREFDSWLLMPPERQEERLLYVIQLLASSIPDARNANSDPHDGQRIALLAKEFATWPVATPQQVQIRQRTAELIKTAVSGR